MTGIYVARGESLPLTDVTRTWLRGDFVRLGDGITHYELTGPSSGSVVVLLGSLTVPLFYWDEVVAGLHGHGLQTLAYSGYGRGYSDRVPGPYDQGLFARQALQLLDAVAPPGPVHLVGSSMGALTALLLTDREPDRVASLSLVGPAGLGQGHPLPVRIASGRMLGPPLARRFGQRLLRAHLSHNVSTPSQVERLTHMVADTYRCQGSVWALMATLADFQLHQQLDLYRRAGSRGVPTSLMWGCRDRVTPISALGQVLELLTPVRHKIVDGGHMVPFEHPALTADELAAFYAELP